MNTWDRIAVTSLGVGALAWVGKLAVIVATGGRVTDDGAAGTLFLVGAVALLLGAGALGFALAARRHPLVRAAAAMATAGAVVASLIALAAVGDAILPASTPQHLAGEFNVAGVALVWTAVAIWAVARAHPGRTVGR